MVNKFHPSVELLCPDVRPFHLQVERVHTESAALSLNKLDCSGAGSSATMALHDEDLIDERVAPMVLQAEASVSTT